MGHRCIMLSLHGGMGERFLFALGEAMSNMIRMTPEQFAAHNARIRGEKSGVVKDLKKPTKPITEVEIYLNIDTLSEANKREHWAAKAKRVREQRAAAKFETLDLLMLSMPLVITLTRISPRSLDDDNCVSSLKAVRDGIADRLAINDRDPRVKWEYAQRRGKKNERAVIVQAVCA